MTPDFAPPDPAQTSLQGMTGRYEALVRACALLRQFEEIEESVVGLEQLCTLLLDAIAQNSPAENCSFMFIAEDRRELELQAAASPAQRSAYFFGTSFWPGKRFAEGEGIAGRVVQTARPIRIDDTKTAPEFAHLPESAVTVRSLLCLPLVHRGKMLGVLNLSHPEPNRFSLEDEQALGVVAQRCARLLARLLLAELAADPRIRDPRLNPVPEDGVLILDPRGTVLQANPAIIELTGFPLEHWRTTPGAWMRQVHTNDRARLEIHRQAALRNSSSTLIEYRFHNAAGKSLRLAEIASPVLGIDGVRTALAVFVRDTERLGLSEMETMRMEAQLLHAQRLHALGQMAGGIAHDLNNLLTGILGNVDLARMTDDLNELRPALDQARAASLRGARLVEKLVAFSASETHPLAPTPIDIGDLLETCAAELRANLGPGVDLVVEKRDAHARALGDAAQVRRVLANLCDNARDAVLARRRADPLHPLRITLGLESVLFDENHTGPWAPPSYGPFLRLYVTDNGIGMDAKTQAHVFEPFFTTKPVGEGLGLGLATVFSIVKHHKGWIDLRSAPGQGACFSVYLPAARQAPSPDPPKHRELPKGSETVLLVDDEAMVRTLGSTILKRLGYAVLTAEDGEDALAVYDARANEIDLVILDLGMPRLTGGEVLRRLRDKDPALPIIISSGQGDAPPDGIDPYRPTATLAKPYLIATMAEVLRDCLEPRRAPSP